MRRQPIKWSQVQGPQGELAAQHLDVRESELYKVSEPVLGWMLLPQEKRLQGVFATRRIPAGRVLCTFGGEFLGEMELPPGPERRLLWCPRGVRELDQDARWPWKVLPGAHLFPDVTSHFPPPEASFGLANCDTVPTPDGKDLAVRTTVCIPPGKELLMLPGQGYQHSWALAWGTRPRQAWETEMRLRAVRHLLSGEGPSMYRVYERCPLCGLNRSEIGGESDEEMRIHLTEHAPVRRQALRPPNVDTQMHMRHPKKWRQLWPSLFPLSADDHDSSRRVVQEARRLSGVPAAHGAERTTRGPPPRPAAAAAAAADPVPPRVAAARPASREAAPLAKRSRTRKAPPPAAARRPKIPAALRAVAAVPPAAAAAAPADGAVAVVAESSSRSPSPSPAPLELGPPPDLPQQRDVVFGGGRGPSPRDDSLHIEERPADPAGAMAAISDDELPEAEDIGAGGSSSPEIHYLGDD